jgi:hypothetical protein
MFLGLLHNMQGLVIDQAITIIKYTNRGPSTRIKNRILFA